MPEHVPDTLQTQKPSLPSIYAVELISDLMWKTCVIESRYSQKKKCLILLNNLRLQKHKI